VITAWTSTIRARAVDMDFRQMVNPHDLFETSLFTISIESYDACQADEGGSDMHETIGN
jgi:hypothetical protein